ncbi:hypothetical protein MUP65_01170 [Patescibacteria group bacterium]|nr:hypothetical protein [Patescibacteria group bacterium]
MRREGEGGFSLIEFLVSIGVMVILFYLGAVVFNSYSARDQLEVGLGRTTASISEAQAKAWANYSQGGAVGLDHGVYFDERAVVVFAASTYSATDPSNQRFELPPRIYFKEVDFVGDEVVFKALTGGVIDFQLGGNSVVLADDHSAQEVTITFNQLGVATLEWQY